jgi:hypothetical protein
MSVWAKTADPAVLTNACCLLRALLQAALAHVQLALHLGQALAQGQPGRRVQRT